MNKQQLIGDNIEPELLEWLSKYDSPIDWLDNIEQLFSKLDKPIIHGRVEDHVSITGPVHIGEGAHIHPFVNIEGPVIIGANVSVRPHAQIRPYAFLGTGCVVGHGADIKRSLCLNESKIQDGTFVGDSVVGSEARIGSGVILANRKFNQAEVYCRDNNGRAYPSGRAFFGALIGRLSRLGANVTTMPGTIVGEHTWVTPGCVLRGTYGSDLLISVKQDLEIKSKDRVLLRSGHGEYEKI
ncbi:MAG: hypothetical protein KTR25_12750 [Myxococcales bacterium]|nr:hypothetical protein [Myxococcales bacterium]